jgi:NitT/TauT family transport system permease protein
MSASDAAIASAVPAAPDPAPPVGYEREHGAWRRWATIVAVHLAAVGAWEVAVRMFHIREFVLPAPSRILATLAVPSYSWASNAWVTALEVFGGYGLGLVLGVLGALLFITSRRLTLVLFPLLVTLNMVPKVAMGPLIIVWFKYGIGPNILITFSLCFFPILLTTIRGLNETEPDLLDLVRALKGSRWQLFVKIQLPGSLPYIFSGMKVAAILAVAGAIVGEFLGSDKGLGYLMLQVQVTLDTPAMFMAVILITLIGIALYGFVMALERLLVAKDARLD